MSMTLPYLEPLAPREPGERQIPELPRRGEPGGPPCGICTGKTTAAVWSDDNWTLHPPVGGSLPGAVGHGVSRTESCATGVVIVKSVCSRARSSLASV